METRLSATAASKRPEPFVTCQPIDYVGFSKNQKLWPLIKEGECLLFADKVKKFRSCGWKQDRVLAITTSSIYNVKGSKSKRAIKISSLMGLSKTLLGAKNEFTIHVRDEYDYRFLIDHRQEAIEIIKHAFADCTRQNLPVFGIPKDSLVQFTTLEKDMKKGITRFPPSQFRLMEEDILEEVASPKTPEEAGQ